MYCPKCAGLNNDDSRFCRVCGADVSFVARAMTRQLPDSRTTRGRRDINRPQGFQKAISSGFMGLGFIVVALCLILTGEGWGIWLFIPGFAMVGKAVSTMAAYKMFEPAATSRLDQNTERQSPTTGELAPQPPSYSANPNSESLYSDMPVPPASVTEGTTKIIEPTIQRARESN